jgi:hypothetical protein
MAHYHEERPHQGLDNALIAPKTTSLRQGPVRCRERLGGVLEFDHREAAVTRRPSFRTGRGNRCNSAGHRAIELAGL